MGRAERRRAERQERIDYNKHKVVMTREEVGKLKNDLMEDISKYNVDALMTCFGLAEHRLYGFGHKRILRTLQYIDDLMSAVNAGETTIEQYKEELKEEVGVVIKS